MCSYTYLTDKMPMYIRASIYMLYEDGSSKLFPDFDNLLPKYV